MKKLSYVGALLASISMNAQFVSPGTGVTYNLTSLAQAAGPNVINNGANFQITKDITISLGDKLLIDENTTVKLDQDVTVYIFGTFQSNSDNLVLTSTVSTTPYKGIRFEEGSSAILKNATIEKGYGIRVNTSDFVMDNCIVQDHKYMSNAPGQLGAVSFGSNINPTIKNSTFINNDYPAMGSAANSTVSAIIENNYFKGNNKSNGNRPQINMGPAGNDSIKIIGNTIIGDRSLTMVGGIALSSIFGAANKFRVENNTIKDNRFGITVSGTTTSGIINNNIIEDNNTQNVPMQGGSGINLLGSGMVVISKNTIKGNLWGVTMQSNSSANLGSDTPGSENIGGNIFKGNINGGQDFALFNNGNKPVEAKFNCWREDELSDDAMVEDVVTHNADNASYGLVNYKPYNCSKLSVNDLRKTNTQVYPNPSNGQFSLKTEKAGNVVITDLAGRSINASIVTKGDNKFNLNAKPGVYILTYVSEGQQSSHKLIIK